jgi:hypothetical protein
MQVKVVMDHRLAPVSTESSLQSILTNAECAQLFQFVGISVFLNTNFHRRLVEAIF